MIEGEERDRDIITLGRYWEGTGIENVPIEWLVLEKTEDYMLLVSKESITSRGFCEEVGNWADSSIREWLNNDFVRQAFNYDEMLMIVGKEITTVYAPDDSPSVVEKTMDRVFLLDEDECERYFPTPDSKIVKQSQYAMNMQREDRKFDTSWWLRNGGAMGCNPMLVTEYGGYYDLVWPAWIAGVRPAIYISRYYYDRIKSKE